MAVCAGLLFAGGLALHADDSVNGLGVPDGQTFEYPPLDPAAWHQVTGSLPTFDRLWGRDPGVSVRGVFPVDDERVALFYTVRVPEGWSRDGFAPHRVTCLAFSRNLLDWEDYADNPVLHRGGDWMVSRRLGLTNIQFDESNARWVGAVDLTGSTGRIWPGIRATAGAYSTNLIDWTFMDGPILTVLDYMAAMPDRDLIELTDEEMLAEGRVYLRWSVEHDGIFYAMVNGSKRVTGEDREYQRVVLKSESFFGPWEFHGMPGDVFVGDTPKHRPQRIGDRWYATHDTERGGKAVIGLAVADDLFGPYTFHPLFEIEDRGRSSPILFQHNGIWAIAYAHHYLQYDNPEAPFGLAITRTPESIPRQ
jgi:hypothetical protein